jgi:hypothetical protein
MENVLHADIGQSAKGKGALMMPLLELQWINRIANEMRIINSRF